MKLPDLLVDLGRAGVTLRNAGSGVGFTPRAALTPERAAAVGIHKPAVLRLLVDGYAPAPDTDAAYIRGERLSIADGLGMPTHPGSPAWLIAVGESMRPGCEIATHRLHSEHGSTDRRNHGGDQSERSDTLRDCQGCGGGP